MNTKNITDYDLQALVDGEVDDCTLANLMDAIIRDPALRARYLTYKAQKSLLKSWWKDN